MLSEFVSAEVEFLLVGACALAAHGYPRSTGDIDLILTSIDGIEFGDAWKNRITIDWDGLVIPGIGVRDLILNKRSTGRTKDLADAEQLERDLKFD